MRISDWSSDVCSSDLHDVTALERAGAGRVRIAGVAEAFDAVLFATGRQPNTGDLGLDAAGVDTDAAGHVCVDARQDTSADGVHAVGEVTDRVALTPVANAAARRMMDRLFGGVAGARRDYEDIPTELLLPPPLGTVSMTDERTGE